MFKLPVHALILFCASRWVIPSVLIPSMVRTTSPIPTCARAALPPSLSWNITRMVNEKFGWFRFIFSEHRTTISYSQKEKYISIFSFVSMSLWKLLHYLSFWWSNIYRFLFLFHLNDRKRIAQYCLFFQNQTPLLLYWLEAVHIHQETQAGIGTQGFLDAKFQPLLSSDIKFFHKRREEGCKPAFSILVFPSQSLQSLCICQWLVTCMEDLINSEADFPHY